MKKILLVIFCLVVILAVGVGIFMATFDVNRYRPLLIQKMEEFLKKPVRLDRIALAWHDGVALEIKGFAVYADPSKEATLLSLEQANLNLQLLPLLQKNIQVSSLVLIGPRLNIERAPDGSIVIPFAVPTTSAGGKQSSASTTSQSVTGLSVHSIRLENGEVDFKDLSCNPPTHLTLRQINATVKDLSPSAPFVFSVQAAVFGDKPNMDLAGTLRLPQPGQVGALDKATLKVSLNDLKVSEMTQALPMLAQAGIREGLEGKLEIGIEHLDLNTDAAKNIKAAVRLTDGKVVLKQISSPIDKIQLDSLLEKDKLTVNNLSAGFAQGGVDLSGTVNQLTSPAPATNAKVAVKDMSLKALLPPQAAAGPSVEGLLSAEFNGKATGLDWPGISRTLSGPGRLGLKNLELINFNVVREVFTRLEVIPGVTESLRAKLPENYRAKIDAADTVFAPVDVPVTISNGQIHFDSLHLSTDHYVLDAQGNVGLDRSIGAQAVIRISRELSAAAVRGVNDLQYLQNAQGELEIPFQIKGVIPNVKIMPDLKYVAKKLLVSKTQGAVTDLISQSLQGNQQQTASQAAAPAGSNPKSTIASFLQKALEKNN